MAGPPSEASLQMLVDKADAASEKGRWARAADLFMRAAQQASALSPRSSPSSCDFRMLALFAPKPGSLASRSPNSGRCSKKRGR